MEVSATDCIRLGVKAPVRLSGDLKGSAPIVIVGPKGAVSLKEGCIVAKRHIHMSPEDAAAFGVHDKQVVSVQAPGARGGLLEEVPVRVDKSFTTEMHIDTDEANGLGICQALSCRLLFDSHFWDDIWLARWWTHMAGGDGSAYSKGDRNRGGDKKK